MAKRIEASGVSSYYGSFKAIDNISMTVEPKTITALIGPSGCGKSTFLRSVNRMHEVLPGARIEGRRTIDDQNFHDHDVDVTAVRRMIGMVFQRPNPFPTMSIYENVVAGLKLNGVKKKSVLDDAAEKSLKSANLWDEVKDRLSRRRPLRRPAAAALHRPHHRGRAAGRPDGRAVLGAGPDLHAGDRGPDVQAEGPLHDHHRHAQHAAGRPGQRQDRVLLDRQDGRPRPPDRVRRHAEDLQ